MLFQDEYKKYVFKKIKMLSYESKHETNYEK